MVQRIRRFLFLPLLGVALLVVAPSCDADPSTFSCAGAIECQEDEKCCKSSDDRYFCCDPDGWGCC